jgi:hypothetical protein
MAGFSPVLMLYGRGDADWAACLMLDLRARGVEVIDGGGRADARADGHGPAALVVVRSWLEGGRVEPAPELVEAVLARGGRYLVVRRNSTILAADDYPGRTHTPFALWDDHYQPDRSRKGKAQNGFGWLLGLLRGADASIDLAPGSGYVFISYHFDSDGPFVHDHLRPVLSRAGLVSWAYRTSERIRDGDQVLPGSVRRPLSEPVRKRIEELVPGASVVLVVSSRQWWSTASDHEVRTARRRGVPVLAVRIRGVAPSGRAVLAGVPSLTLDSSARSAKTLVDALVAAGARPLPAP